MNNNQKIIDSLKEKSDEELVELWKIGSAWLSEKIMENKEKDLIKAGIRKIELLEDEMIKRGIEYE